MPPASIPAVPRLIPLLLELAGAPAAGAWACDDRARIRKTISRARIDWVVRWVRMAAK